MFIVIEQFLVFQQKYGLQYNVITKTNVTLCLAAQSYLIRFNQTNSVTKEE